MFNYSNLKPELTADGGQNVDTSIIIIGLELENGLNFLILFFFL